MGCDGVRFKSDVHHPMELNYLSIEVNIQEGMTVKCEVLRDLAFIWRGI